MTLPDPARPLAGRVAVVTGASRGIGQAICLRLAAPGAQNVGVDLLDLTETAALVATTGAEWSGWSFDVTDENRIAELARALSDDPGRADILVNNAAIDDAVGFDDLDLDRFRRVLKVDLEAPFLLIKALIPLMRAGGYGRIVNISSGSVVNPITGFVAYRAAKTGIIGLTRALSSELGRDGITVNAISPGVTETVMATNSLTPEFFQLTIAKQGIKRTGQPADLASAVAFIAGPEAGFITGQTLMVNGGAAFT